jgi:hypothetical protein
LGYGRDVERGRGRDSVTGLSTSRSEHKISLYLLSDEACLFVLRVPAAGAFVIIAVKVRGGGSTTNVWSQQLGIPVLDLSSELSNLLV